MDKITRLKMNEIISLEYEMDNLSSYVRRVPGGLLYINSCWRVGLSSVFVPFTEFY
jgi:hypothetical protein